MIYITKQVHFCAAHRLYNPDWDRQKNEEIFGPCANENWHGHNYDLYITIKGEPARDTGMVMNFKDLKKLVNREILDVVDHKNLDLDVPFMKGKFSSCEILIAEIWKILDPLIKENTNNRAVLHKLKLYETPTSYAEYYGE